MDEMSETKTAMAALFVSLVKALDEKTPGLALSFLKHLGEACADLEEAGQAPGENEILSWSKDRLQCDADFGEPAWVVYGRASEDPFLPLSEQVEMPALKDALAFWAKLPDHERGIATIETASGRRLDTARIKRLLNIYRVDLV